jgi:hypothetical protein
LPEAKEEVDCRPEAWRLLLKQQLLLHSHSLLREKGRGKIRYKYNEIIAIAGC